MRYSQEFKDNVVARLLSKELSISEAVERYSIGKSTISYWLRIAREQAVCGTLPNKGNLKPMTSLKLPKGVTYLQAHSAVVAREIMSETAFGQFCADGRTGEHRFICGDVLHGLREIAASLFRNGNAQLVRQPRSHIRFVNDTGNM